MTWNCEKPSTVCVTSVFLFSLCLLIGWILYILLGHRVIEILYEKGSIEFLNRIIEKQGPQSLDFYFTEIDSLFYTLATFYTAIGIVSIFWVFGISLIVKDDVLKKYLFMYFIFAVLLFFVRLGRVKQHYDVLEHVFLGTALAPNLYRILIPWLAFLVKSVIPTLSWMNSARIWNFIFILSTLPLFHKYLEKWFERKTCFLITVILIYLLPVSFAHDYPSDFFELMVFITGFMVIRDKKDYFLYPLIFLATFGRPTALFLVIAYFVSNVERKNISKVFFKSLTFFMCWLIPIIGLLMIRGVKPYRCEIVMILKEFDAIGSAFLLRSQSLFDFLFFFFPFCFIYLLFKKRKPCSFLRRNIMTVAVIFLACFVIGSVLEFRILYPALPILVPLAFYPLFGSEGEKIKPIHLG